MQGCLELLFGDFSFHTVISFYTLNSIQKPNGTNRSTEEGAELTQYYYWDTYFEAFSTLSERCPRRRFSWEKRAFAVGGSVVIGVQGLRY